MDTQSPPTSTATPDESGGGLFARARWLYDSAQKAGEPYRLTRFMLLRFTGLLYLVAFLVAAQQFIPLVGHDGLLPADLFIERATAQLGSRWDAFKEIPSLFWYRCTDDTIRWVTWGGVALSVVVLCGYANALMMLALWALYLSLLPIGQIWLGYGWDIQLLETGFLAVLLCPVLDPRPFPARPPPVLVIWLYRWLIFRIMLGAGLIKLRGDPIWRNLTALYYHYETQPIPNPLSRLLHFAPKWFHQAGVLWNFFVELVAPWFVIGGQHATHPFRLRPATLRHIAGVILVSFQLILIASGNLSFLNWLTIVPCLACFDDSFWRRILPGFLVRWSEASAHKEDSGEGRHRLRTAGVVFQTAVSAVFFAAVVWMSYAPVMNLLSPRQAMNTSFDRLHLVNTYGAFGSVDQERLEIVFEGTSDPLPEEISEWKEYEFKAKPGDPMRRPPIITPYHYRLDWQTWYPWSRYGMQPWMVNFIWKLLHNDPGTLSLLANNPFPDAPPKYVRAILYHYEFAPLGNPDGAWWVRKRESVWLRPVSVNDPSLRRMVQSAGWMRGGK